MWDALCTGLGARIPRRFIAIQGKVYIFDRHENSKEHQLDRALNHRSSSNSAYCVIYKNTICSSNYTIWKAGQDGKARAAGGGRITNSTTDPIALWFSCTSSSSLSLLSSCTGVVRSPSVPAGGGSTIRLPAISFGTVIEAMEGSRLMINDGYVVVDERRRRRCRSKRRDLGGEKTLLFSWTPAFLRFSVMRDIMATLYLMHLSIRHWWKGMEGCTVILYYTTAQNQNSWYSENYNPGTYNCSILCAEKFKSILP